MFKKIIFILCILFVTSSIYAEQDTQAGISMNFDIANQTSVPDTTTFYDYTLSIDNVAFKYQDTPLSKTYTYRGNFTSSSTYSTSLKFFNKNQFFSPLCTSGFTSEHECVLDYSSLTPYNNYTLYYTFCNDVGICSTEVKELDFYYYPYVNLTNDIEVGTSFSFGFVNQANLPDKSTFYDYTLSSDNVAFKYLDNLMQEIVYYRGNFTSLSTYNTSLKFFYLNEFFSPICTSDFTNDHQCSINYSSLTPKTNYTFYYIFCSDVGICSTEVKNLNFLYEPTNVENEIEAGTSFSFDFIVSGVEPNQPTFYDYTLSVDNIAFRYQDNPINKTYTYRGNFIDSSTYPTNLKFFNLNQFFSPLCTSNFSSEHECIINYTTMNPLTDYTFYYTFCNDVGICSTEVKTTNFFFYPYMNLTNDIKAGINFNFEIVLAVPNEPYYVEPTPRDFYRRTNVTNFTVKINKNRNYISNPSVVINNEKYDLVDNHDDTYEYTYILPNNPDQKQKIEYQVFYYEVDELKWLSKRELHSYPLTNSKTEMPATSFIASILGIIFIGMFFKMKGKKISKKGISGVVVVSLMVLIVVVTGAGVAKWYLGFQSDYYGKVEYKFKETKIEGIKFQNNTAGEVIVKNQGRSYYIIKNVTVGGSKCDTLQNNVIGENAITIIDINCTNIKKGSNELVIYTNLKVLNKNVFKSE